jgi:hypothetical protein
MCRSPLRSASVMPAARTKRVAVANRLNIGLSPSVFLVGRLPGDPQGGSDLFPGPALAPPGGHVLGLELIGQPAQSHHRTQADRRVVRPDCLT